MRYVKHINAVDVFFERIASVNVQGGEMWSGYWWTIGTTGVYRTIHDTILIRPERMEEWREYIIPEGHTINY